MIDYVTDDKKAVRGEDELCYNDRNHDQCGAAEQRSDEHATEKPDVTGPVGTGLEERDRAQNERANHRAEETDVIPRARTKEEDQQSDVHDRVHKRNDVQFVNNGGYETRYVGDGTEY